MARKIIRCPFLFRAFIFLAFLRVNFAFCAACCGGSSGAQLLILDDDQAVLGVSQRYSKLIGFADALGQSYFYENERVDQSLITSVKYSKAFLDRYQAGVEPTIVWRQIGLQNRTTLGDTHLLAGYEFWPDWQYIKYRPRGIVSLSISLPTGKSPEGLNLGQVPTGSGAIEAALGVRLSGLFDRLGWPSVSWVFYPEVGNKKAQFLSSVSYLHQRSGVSVGASVSPQFTYLVEQSGLGLVWGFSAFIGAYFFDQDQLSLSYLDQTLIGPVRQTNFERGISVNWTRHFPL